MRLAQLAQLALVVVLVGALTVSAQDQTTTPKISWKERAKLDYQRRYDKYILHKKEVDEENAITSGDNGSESNAIPLGTRSGVPPPPPPPSPPLPAITRPPIPPTTRLAPPPTTTTRRPPPTTTTRRPPPPPTTTTTRRPPPPSTTPYRPPPPPSTTLFRAPPTTTITTRPPAPPTTVFRPPPTTLRPTSRRTTEPPAVLDLGFRGGFPSEETPILTAAPSGGSSSVDQQSTVSGTFQSRPGTFPMTSTGGSFASSSATAFNNGGEAGGASTSNAGTFNGGGTATGTFTFTTGGYNSASGSTTGAVSKSPVALLGKVVQGIVRPITSILPAPLGPKGSNPGLVGGLVSGIFEELDGGIRAIYPGTLWCGAGNVARSEDEVGLFRSTDKCCRQHDNCPDSIAAGANKYGLRNTGTFTRSHCNCDDAFYSCLKADRKSIVSIKVGTTYFNLLRPRCFRPVTTCTGGGDSNCTTSYRWTNNRIF